MIVSPRPGQPQPPRIDGGDKSRQAGGVARVVELHSHAVGAGDHHRRVGGTLPQARLDDDADLGPCREPGHQVRPRPGRCPMAVGDIRVVAGERDHPDRHGAIAGQWLSREVEAVRNDLAAWSVRDVRQARLAAELPDAIAAADVGARRREQPDEHRQHRGHDHADHPAAHAAELCPLRSEQPAKPGQRGLRLGADAGARDRRRVDGHRATSLSAPAGRNSTSSFVSSM